MPETSSHVQAGKAQFGHLYNQSDPRGYFQTLGELDYQAPAHGERVFARLLQQRRRHLRRQEVVVLDLCCSYGINAALLNHDLTLDRLYDRYRAPQLAELSTDELVEADRAFYGEHRHPRPAPVVGIDVADRAVAYAQRVGLHWASSSENLETAEPSAALADQLTDVDLVTVTGGIGYITERTFERVLRHASSAAKCWVAAFVLRWVPYDRVADVLAGYGLVTEQPTAKSFRQRRFADEGERDYVLAQLDSQGIDPAGRETDGWHHSSFYLSRPVGEDRPPGHELLSGCLS